MNEKNPIEAFKSLNKKFYLASIIWFYAAILPSVFIMTIIGLLLIPIYGIGIIVLILTYFNLIVAIVIYVFNRVTFKTSFKNPEAGINFSKTTYIINIIATILGPTIIFSAYYTGYFFLVLYIIYKTKIPQIQNANAN